MLEFTNNRFYQTTFLLTILIGCFACNSSNQDFNFNETESMTTDQKVELLLAKMTLEEKVGQMNQYSGFMDFTGPKPKGGEPKSKLEDIKAGRVGAMLNVHGVENVKAVQKLAVEESRLGIPLLFGFDVIHGYKTISPIPLAEAASWDLKLIKRSAEIAAEEAASAGINWTFAPMVDISRDARWGRVMEGAGEDPYLASKIAYARVKGFQGEDLSKPNTIAACAKHFSAYGFVESGKEYNTVDVGTTTLHNVIHPPFKAAIEADVKTFMSAFNVLNGIPATGNEYLHRNLLKEHWNFKGFVVSDWASVSEMVDHGFADSDKTAAKLAVNAGNDMDMESYSYLNHLVSLVKNGDVEERLIDDAIRRILKLKFELGLFENPYLYCDAQREINTLYQAEFKKDILNLARKSIVLLKNENNLLPLSPFDGDHKKIAVIGELAKSKSSPLGSWRLASDNDSAISLIEGLKNYDTDIDFSYHKGVDLVNGKATFTKDVDVNTSDFSEFQNAIDAAKSSDLVIMMLGEHGFQSGEARSRTNLDLPGLQKELLKEVFQVNPNIVLVLQNGRSLTLTWEEKHIPVIVEAWQLGTFSGEAIADILFGKYNPSGKLPMSFPRSVGQLPLYYNHLPTGRGKKPEEDLVFWTHYTDEENSALFPFGYGLSYTNFKLENLKVHTEPKDDTLISLSVELTNTGKFEGAETVQLYINDPVAQISRPVKELKAFQQVFLKPNEKKVLHFHLSKNNLGYYLPNGNWIFEEGLFNFYVGTNSEETLHIAFSI